MSNFNFLNFLIAINDVIYNFLENISFIYLNWIVSDFLNLDINLGFILGIPTGINSNILFNNINNVIIM